MKFCGNCGNELLDNFTFCPRCGRQIADNAAPYQSDAQSQYQQAPQYRPTDYDDIFGENYPPQSTGIKAMIFGILSIWISFIPGIIFACIARKTAKEVFDANPHSKAARFAKIGKITAAIGLPLSIIYTIIYPFICMIYYEHYYNLFYNLFSSLL